MDAEIVAVLSEPDVKKLQLQQSTVSSSSLWRHLDSRIAHNANYKTLMILLFFFIDGL